MKVSSQSAWWVYESLFIIINNSFYCPLLKQFWSQFYVAQIHNKVMSGHFTKRDADALFTETQQILQRAASEPGLKPIKKI